MARRLREASPTLTIEQAFARVAQENPELFARERRQARKRLTAA